jgi:hypothetical protein
MENLNELITLINKLLIDSDTKQPDIPNALIAVGGKNKKGLSARELAKDIIVEQTSAGAPVGPLPDGEESISEKMEYVRAKNIIEHFIKNAKIKVVIPPGTPVEAYGLDSTGAPVTVRGVTSGFAVGTAIIQ